MHWTEISDRLVGDVVVLDLRGHMTLSDEEGMLFRHVSSLMEEGRARVVLNLRHVPYIDSPGIGEIVRSFTRLTRKGGTLKLCDVSPRVQEIVVATNLNTIIEMFESENVALRSLGV